MRKNLNLNHDVITNYIGFNFLTVYFNENISIQRQFIVTWNTFSGSVFPRWHHKRIPGQLRSINIKNQYVEMHSNVWYRQRFWNVGFSFSR